MQLEFHQIATRYEKLRVRVPGADGRLTASLAQHGQLNPVLVVSSPSEPQGYVLIDGYRRVSALRAMGRDTVEAMELSLCESAALILWYGQQSGPRRCMLSDGWLIRELMQLHGINQSEVSRRLERTDSWISRRLSLVTQLPESVQEQVRRGQLSAWAAMKYFVPLARANRDDCQKLGNKLGGQRLSTRQIHRIYVGYKRGNREQRDKIAGDPILFLKASQELERTDTEDKEHADEMSALLEDMEILVAVSGRARRRLRAISDAVRFPEPVVLAWQAARGSLAALSQTVKDKTDAR
jgi:ParB family transcriptional regulator, chromosome partitioning protein